MKTRMRILSMLLCLAMLMSALPGEVVFAPARAEAQQEAEAPQEQAPEVAQPQVVAEVTPVEAPAPVEAPPAETLAEDVPVSDDAVSDEGAQPDGGEASGDGESLVEGEQMTEGENSVEEASSPEAEDEADIDYGRDASVSPHFTRGFVEVLQSDTPVYDGKSKDAELLVTLGAGVALALERVDENAKPDRLRIAFNLGGEVGIRDGWVDAKRVRPMEPTQEVPAYQKFCAPLENILYYKENAELPLARMAYTLPERDDANGENAQASDSAVLEQSGNEATTSEQSGADAGVLIPEESHPVFMPEVLPSDDGASASDGTSGENVESEQAAQADAEYAVAPERTDAPVATDAPQLSVGDVADPAISDMPVVSDMPIVSDEPLSPVEEDSDEEGSDAPATSEEAQSYVEEIDDLQISVMPLPLDDPLFRVEDVAPEIEQDLLQMYPGSVATLDLTLPEDAAPQLTSSDEAVATVSEAGEVVAVAPGEATITVAVGDGADECTVFVVAPPKINLSTDTLELRVGESVDLVAEGIVSCSAESAALDFSWQGACINVSPSGVLQALSAGTGTVQIVESSSSARESLRVEVLPVEAGVTMRTSLTLQEGETAALDIALPEDGSDGFQLTSDSSFLVPNEADGTVTALSLPEGSSSTTGTITLRTEDGQVETCAVTVLSGPARIALKQDSITLTTEETGRRIEATAYDGSNRPVACEFEYVVAEPQIVTVSNGELRVQANQTGDTTVTVRAKGAEGVSASCAVHVLRAAKRVTLRQSAITLGVGDSFQISDGAGGIVAVPEGERVSSYTYSSSSASYAAVSADGVITAKKKGSAKITITPAGGSAVTLTVTVKPASKTLAFSTSELVLGPGASGKLSVTFSSGAAADYTIATSDPSGSAVSFERDGTTDNWIITAKKVYTPTTVTLTASSTLKGYKDSCAVIVLPGPANASEITFTATKTTLGVGETGGQVTASVAPGVRAAGGFTYTSSNEAALTVAADGTLTARAASSTPVTITATAAVPYAEGAYASASLQVDVLSGPEKFAIASGKETLNLGVGDTYSLADDPDGILSITPEGARVSCTYAASAKNNKNTTTALITVSEDGVITAKKAGTAYVRIAPTSGRDTSVKVLKVVVTKATSALTLSASSLRMNVGMSENLTISLTSKTYSRYSVTVEGERAANGEAGKVVELVQDGQRLQVRALRPGSATIAVYSEAKGLADTCAITVSEAPTAQELAEGFSAPEVIGVGETGQRVSVSYPEEKFAKISFRSSSPNVLAVDANTGALTAKAAGNVRISVLCDGAEACSLPVRVAPQPTAMELVQQEVTLEVGRTYLIDPAQLVRLTSPADCRAIYSYSASSKNNKVAATTLISVSADGVITAKKAGTAYVRILTQNKNCYKYMKVTVVKAGTGFVLDPDRLTLGVGMTASLRASNAPEGELSYDYDGEIVSVGADGTVKALKPGTAYVTARVGEEVSAVTCVTVRRAPEAGEIRISEDSTQRIGRNQRDARVVAVIPEDAMAELRYRVAGACPAGVTLNETTGALTYEGAAGEGSFDVVAYDANSNVESAPFTVRIVNTASLRGLEPASIQLGVGEVMALTDGPGGVIRLSSEDPNATASYSFETYSDKNCKKKNATVASVTADGMLTGKKAGTAYVKVDCDAGGSAVLTVKVAKQPATPTLSPASLTLGVGMTGAVKTSYPGGYTFASSDDRVVTVDANGTVTAVGAGSATVTMTAWNGKTDACLVRVLPAPSSVKLLPAEGLTIGIRQTGASVAAEASEDGTMAVFRYRSENTAVVNVDESTGALTPVAPGVATVTVTLQGNPGVQAQTQVTVKAAPTALVLHTPEIRLGIGDTHQIAAYDPQTRAGDIETSGGDVFACLSYYPSTNSKKNTKSTLVTVDEDGLITAKKAGTAYVRISDQAGHVQSMKVVVSKLAGSVSLNAAELTMGVGMSKALAVQFPSKTFADYEISISDENIATLTADEKAEQYTVVARAVGDATVTVRTQSGKVDTCHIAVLPGTSQIHWSFTAGTGSRVEMNESGAYVIGVGEKNVQIEATPDEGTLAEFTFTSSNANAVKVSAAGALTASAAGSANITISAPYSDAVQDVVIPVQVLAKPASGDLSLTQTTLNLGVGDVFQIEEYDADTNPGGIVVMKGSSASYTYKSSSTAIATVSANGLITAKKAGTTTVRISTQNTKVYKDLKVNVSKYTTSMSIPSELTIGAGMTASLAPTFSSGASALMEFMSSDLSVVRVDAHTGEVQGGSVNALSRAIVTATMHKTGETAVCNVTVLPAPGSIEIDYAALGASVAYDESGAPYLRVGVNEKNVTVPVRCTESETLCGYSFALVSGSAKGLVVNAETGALSAKTAGDYVVAATASNNPSAAAQLRVKVVPAPTKLAYTDSKLQLGVGDSYRITEHSQDGDGGILVLTPAEASASYSFAASKYSNKTATTDVLSISSDGVITAKKAGTAYVKTTTQNSKSAVLTVTVVKNPDSVGLIPENMRVGELCVGKLELTYPSGGFSLAKEFESSEPGLLQVDANGVVTAGKLSGREARQVTVTATTQSGATASTVVTVLPHPDRVEFSQGEYVLSAGMTLSTGALKFPVGTMAQRVRYSVDNAQVAIVDPSSGEIKGVGSGVATITATINPGEGEGYEVSGAATVRVIAAPARISYEDTGLPAKLQIALKDTVTLPEPLAYSETGEIVPAQYSYALNTASDKNYITLTGNQITGKKVGKDVKIKVKSQNGASTTLTVRVYNNKASAVQLFWGERDVTNGSIEMYVNEEYPTDTVQLTGSLAGTNINYGSLSFTSSEERVATVDASGRITAHATGRATITAAALSGASASVTVTVGARCTSVTPEQASYLLPEGETAQIRFTFNPQNSGMRVRYASENPLIATVDDSGLITAVAGGATSIAVEGQDGETLASIPVTVLYNPDAVALPASKLCLAPGESVTLKPELTRAQTEPQQINVRTTATSSNDTIVSVVELSAADQLSGTPASYTVTAVAQGEATITIQAGNDLSQTCTVVVDGSFANGDATGFGWDENRKLAMVRGDSVALEFGMSSAVFKGEAQYTVASDSDVLTVSGDMRSVTANRAGTAKLTLSVNGVEADVAEIQVVEPVKPQLWCGEGFQESVGKSIQLDLQTYTAPGAKHEMRVDPLPDLDESYLLLGQYEVEFSDPSLLTFERDAVDELNGGTHDTIRTTELAGKTTATVRTYGSEVTVEVEVINGVTYRALLISEYNGSMKNNLPFAQGNISLMSATLGSSDIGGQKYEITTLKNPKKSSIKSAIASTFADAKEYDVNLIYIMAHGHMGSGSYANQYCFSLSMYSTKDTSTYITDSELMSALKGLTGKTVLILDSCNSGAFISHQSGSGLSSGGNIAVITAQVGNKSASYHVKGGGATEATFEFFTRALCRGMGNDQFEGRGALYADSDGDGMVTLGEAFAFARPLTSQWATQCALNHFYPGKSYGFKAPSVSTNAKRDQWVNSDGGETPQSFIPASMSDLVIFGTQPQTAQAQDAQPQAEQP